MSQNSNIIEILSKWLVRSFDQVLNDSCVNYILSRPLSDKRVCQCEVFSFSSFLLVLVENKLPVHVSWTNNLFELFPRYLKYHTYSCISRPPFLSTKIRFFIISGQRGSIQTDRDFPKVNLLFLGMYWRHGELKNCRAQCNRVLWSLSALVYITTT